MIFDLNARNNELPVNPNREASVMIGSSQDPKQRSLDKKRRIWSILIDVFMGVTLLYLAMTKSDLAPEIVVWVAVCLAGVLIASAMVRLYLFATLKRFQSHILDAFPKDVPGADGLDRTNSPKRHMDT